MSVGREIIGRVVDAAPGRPVLRSPNLVAAQPRLLLLFIRRAVAGRVTPARKLLEFPPAARPQVTVSPPALLPPPPPECLMLHKGEAVARSRPRPAPSFPPCLIASSPGLQVLGVPHGTTTRVSHGVRHWCPTKCSPCPQSSPSLGQARGGQPSYGCHCHRRTCLHLLIVLGLLLACHGGAEKL